VRFSFGNQLRVGNVVILTGPLGAGKTVFVRGVVSSFNPAIAVTSPTFSIINVYAAAFPIYHIDLYRLETEIELLEIGLQEYVGNTGLALIEWGEKCERLLPTPYYRVRMSISDDQNREIDVEEVKVADSRA
jgi:tRNA threonylcarbamoyladenosine biosynthesis protein TsaE